MAPTPLANRAATTGAASCKTSTAAVTGHQAPNKGRNQLALLSLSAGALLASPVVDGAAVAAELPPPAPVTQQVQHISSTTAVKFPSVKAPQGESGLCLALCMHACICKVPPGHRILAMAACDVGRCPGTAFLEQFCVQKGVRMHPRMSAVLCIVHCKPLTVNGLQCTMHRTADTAQACGGVHMSAQEALLLNWWQAALSLMFGLSIGSWPRNSSAGSVLLAM